QFPWRFAGPAALFAALAVALLVSWTSASLGRRAALVLELLLFALCTLQALPRLLQYEPLPAPVRDRLEPALAPAALLRSPLPAGSYELELRYEPPAARRAGLWLSGIALLSCAAIALAGARPGRSAQPGPGPFARATQR